MAQSDNAQAEIFRLLVNEKVKGIFLSLAKWAKFLSVLGFIMMVICALIFTISGQNNQHSLPSSSAGKAGYLFGYFLGASAFLAALGFYPNYALLKYANKIKAAMATSDQVQFEKGITYLRNSFIYIGILFIICLAFLLIAIFANMMDLLKILR